MDQQSSPIDDINTLINQIPFYTALFLFYLVMTRGCLRESLLLLIGSRLALRFLFHNKRPFMEVNRFTDGAPVVGHRGCAVEAPENTLAAISMAYAQGIRAVEIDIEFSADDVPMIIHDDTLDRTTDGKGPVNALRMRELKKLSASVNHKYADQFVGETIPTLEEALRLAHELGLRVYLDVKGDSPFRVGRALSDLYKLEPRLFDRVAVCSFYPHIIYIVRWYLPHLVTGLTHRPHGITYEDLLKTQPRFDNDDWRAWVGPVVDFLLEPFIESVAFRLCGSSLYLMNEGVVSDHLVNYWANRGITVVVWTVNDIDQKKRFAKGPRPVIYMTDEISQDRNPL